MATAVEECILEGLDVLADLLGLFGCVTQHVHLGDGSGPRFWAGSELLARLSHRQPVHDAWRRSERFRRRNPIGLGATQRISAAEDLERRHARFTSHPD